MAEIMQAHSKAVEIETIMRTMLNLSKGATEWLNADTIEREPFRAMHAALLYRYNDNEERIQDFISSFAVFKGLTLKQIIAENNMAVETMEEVFKDLLK